jgi:hypothetical protein
MGWWQMYFTPGKLNSYFSMSYTDKVGKPNSALFFSDTRRSFGKSLRPNLNGRQVAHEGAPHVLEVHRTC